MAAAAYRGLSWSYVARNLVARKLVDDMDLATGLAGLGTF